MAECDDQGAKLCRVWLSKMSEFEVRRGAINIPITVRVSLSDGWGGERWDVLEVIDERSGQSIGDIGIYEFDAYSDFPEAILAAVLRTLVQSGEFKVSVFYSVEISIKDGGNFIGSASRYFQAPYSE